MGDFLDRIYCGPAPEPAGIWLRWNLDPVLLVGLALLAWWIGRSRSGVAAIAVLLVAFVSPLCALSSALFSARVVHHVLLIAVAAPLIALARPARGPASASPWFVVSATALWLWHWPAAYDLALSNVAAYWAMQLTLLVPSVLMWRALLASGSGSSLLLIPGTFVQMGMLGAVLTFAPQALYEVHVSAPLMWGLSPLADQQLGGLLMWMPAGIPLAVFGGLAVRRRWQELEARSAC